MVVAWHCGQRLVEQTSEVDGALWPRMQLMSIGLADCCMLEVGGVCVENVLGCMLLSVAAADGGKQWPLDCALAVPAVFRGKCLSCSWSNDNTLPGTNDIILTLDVDTP